MSKESGVEKVTERVTNTKFAETNREFQKAYAKVSLKPTSRQASKWRRQMGQAWKEGR